LYFTVNHVIFTPVSRIVRFLTKKCFTNYSHRHTISGKGFDIMSIIPITHNRSPAAEEMERTDQAPMLVMIGGVLTFPTLMPYYWWLLGSDRLSGAPKNKRFVAPHGFGIGSVEDTRKKTGEALLRSHDAGKQRKMLLVGHSLGALIATDFACEYPETIAGVICLAGAQEGVKHNTLAMKKLVRFINNPTATDMVKHDSSFMQEHRERVRTDWPEGVPLHAVAPALDVLLPPPHGFRLRPNGLPSTNRLIVPTFAADWDIVRRRQARSPSNTETIETPLAAGHINVPNIQDAVKYVRAVQTELAGLPTPHGGSLPEAV
jgi:pimeloyl-ACP methyl ester carboxylesterase